MSKKMKGVMEDFEIIFTPDGDLGFDAEADYVLSGADVNTLEQIMVELKQIDPDLADKIQNILNNLVEV
jgi:hypothetical protein